MEKRMHGGAGKPTAARAWNSLSLDLHIQILYFLPVKTLLVLRAVSKWFLSTIDDPDFVTSHLCNFPQNIRQTTLLIAKSMEVSFPTITDYDNRCGQLLRSSVDGISIFNLYIFGRMAPHAILTNFSTQKISLLPSRVAHHFLGYDATRKDYRVIAKTSSQVWICSMKMYVWEEITTRSGFRGANKNLELVICSQSLCFENALVWTESSQYEPDSLCLVWFGFEDEIFRYSEKIPSFGSRRNGLMLLDGGSTLGVWMVNDVVGSIWALQTNTMTWAKRYEVPKELLPFGVGIKVANVVFFRGKIVSWCWNEEEKSIEIVSYDIRTCAINRHRKQKYVSSDRQYFCLGGVYIQILIKF